MVGSWLEWNGSIFPDDIPVNIQSVTSLFLFNIRELDIGAKTRKFW